MGSDESITQAARTSYGKGTKSVREDAGLIRYLMAHRHTTPLEMVEYKFHIKCPIFVARQILRHRTASVNEYSLRYSEAKDEFYAPDQNHVGVQDTVNKQGRILGGDPTIDAATKISIANHDGYFKYQQLLGDGVPRELARVVLPLSNYTEFYWKMNLHNLLHFLQLRMDDHSQYETRVFANAIAEFVKKNNPLAWEAFDEYVLGAVTFSKGEMRNLKEFLQTDYIEVQSRPLDYDYFEDAPSDKTLQRRRQEFIDKIT